MTINLQKHHARRAILLGFLGFLVLPATQGIAGGDGGGGSSTAPNKPPSLKERYTQAELSQLSKAEIKILFVYRGRVKPGGKRISVDGFSSTMTEWLISMLVFDKASSRRLIRDMARLKDPKKRKARLQQEKAKIEHRIGKLKQSLKRAEDKGHTHAVAETKSRLAEAKEYLAGVKTWIEFPHEGTR